MPLGIEQDSIAPQLIQNAGSALVQGIRQIGQQISSHLTEIQTKRDLAAMAQDMQGVNPQSAEFPVALTQLVSRHPLAAQDQRGLLALNILGKAHGEWQAGEAEARAFNRAMALQGYRTRAAKDLLETKSHMPQNVGGALVIPNDPVTGQPNVLIPPPSRAGSNRPVVLGPGAKAIDATGKVLAENPKAVTPLASEARMLKKQKIDLLMRQDTAAREEFGRLERRRDALSKERMAISKADDPNAVYLDNTIRAIEEEAKKVRDRRTEIQKAIEGIESVPAEEQLPPVPPDAAGAAILPPPGALTAPDAPAEMVMVVDPSGRPGRIKASQLDAALQNGYKRR